MLTPSRFLPAALIAGMLFAAASPAQTAAPAPAAAPTSATGMDSNQLSKEIKSVGDLANNISGSIDKVTESMRAWSESSKRARQDGQRLNVSVVNQSIQDLKGYVIQILDKTSDNGPLMDQMEDTIEEITLRRERSPAYVSGATGQTLKDRWTTQLTQLEEHKAAINGLRTEAENNLSELLTKETLIAELADINDAEGIVVQLNAVTGQLKELSVQLGRLAKAADPLANPGQAN